MKVLLLTAIIAVATSNPPLSENQKWPWQVGKEYVYDVDTYTWTKFENSDSNGIGFKTQLIIRVKTTSHLVAKLENPLYAQIQGSLNINEVPSDLKYRPVQQFTQSFEIFVEGGRILSLNVPFSLSVCNENILKGLVSALQADLSNSDLIHSFPNSFDKESFQGVFKKMEADVTGDCETLYSVSPVSAEWRRELPNFVDEPVEITKSKNYGSCKKHVAYDFGVPEGAVWKGITYENEKKQFIKHTSESRLLVGKQGTIYKSVTTSSVLVNPLLFGKQKAEVYSYVGLVLSSVQPEGSNKWQISNEVRTINSLLGTLSESTFYPVNTQAIVNTQKLLQNITPLLQNPSQLPESDFLSKFNVLVNQIISMDSQQLTQMTSSIEVTRFSQKLVKKNMWKIYRDAVAQAGSIAAFKEIKSWILAKKIQGEEAAEVIGSVASVLRYPTKEVLNEFFELAFNPDVLEQKFLNTSTLLAASKLMRLTDEDLFVVHKVIPRLFQELKQAVEKSDNSKADVYIRVLGNLGHPEILKVFAPYFDGRIPVAKYLRIQMVISLKTLANLRNKYVRVVLFSLLRNTAEPYEVRVAAALNIFLAYPTAEMMQIMAHMSNDDPNTHVRTVLANRINYAAGLKNPRFAELAKIAKAGLSVIAKENIKYDYSINSILDEYTSDDDYTHFREVSFIGSENSILPVYLRAGLRLRGNGWTEEEWFTLSMSDMQLLFDYIAQKIYKPRKVDVDFKFSTKKIIEALNIKRKPRTPLEGSFLIDSMNQQKLFTFNEEDLAAFISGAVKNIGLLMTGVESNYVKLMTQKQVYVAFPLVAGMPFVYTYSEPIVFIFHGKANTKLGFDNGVSLNTEIKFTYARNLDGSVGLLDTLNGVYATSGIVNKFQLYIPTKLKTKVKSEEIKLSFKLPDDDATLVHLSVWPYTTIQKINSQLAASENPASKVIKRSTKVVSTDLKLGQLTGVGLFLQGYSYSSDFKTINVFGADILTSICNLLYQKDMALTVFDLKYSADETKNNVVTYTIFFDTLFNEKQSSETIVASIPRNVASDSEGRREEVVKRAASGIKSAKIQLVDISAEFDGEQKVEYVLTAALATSVVDNQVKAAVFTSGTDQINAVFKLIKPEIVPVKVPYEVDIEFGKNSALKIKGVAERSDKLPERLLWNDPSDKQCLQEISEGNFYQKNCHKIIKAYAPDNFKATVIYSNLSLADVNLTGGIYDIYKHFVTWEVEKSVFEKVGDGEVDIKVQTFYYDNYINYEITSKYGIFRFKSVANLASLPYYVSLYTPITNWELSRNLFTGYLPFCSVNHNKVWTFSGRTYNYSLTSSWHVVMVDESNDFSRWDDLVILTRKLSSKHVEVYVSYKTETGKYVEVDIKPESIDVKTNTNKVSEGVLTSYWDDVAKTPLLEYYTLKECVKVFSFKNGRLHLVYDRQRLTIFTDEHRSTTTGLCGQSTTQICDDYMTPFGLVDLPELYGASFSLDGEFNDAKTVELKKEAKLKAYQPVTRYTNVLHSDAEWSKVENDSIKGHPRFLRFG